MLLEGSSFIFAARTWLRWVREDVRSRHAYEHLLAETEEARTALGAVVARNLPVVVEMRRRLEEAGGAEIADAPRSDSAPSHRERFTFRHFDALADVLAGEAGQRPRLHARPGLTDPLRELREILRAKLMNFIDTTRQPDGDVSPNSGEVKHARLERIDSLGDWSLGTHEALFTLEIEPIGMLFSSSAGRAARILEDVLERSLTLSYVRDESWFQDGVGTLDGTNTNAMTLARALLEKDPSRRPANAGDQTISEWAHALKPIVRQCASGIRERIGERALLISAIDRFRMRAERYDSEALREAAQKHRAKGRRQAEARLTRELARYLFDAGFETFCEVPSGEGRADLIQAGEVYVEAKQVSSASSDRARIIAGYRQAMDGIRQFGVRAAVLAIYVLDGPRYAPVPVVPARDGAPETHVVVIDLRPAAARGSKRPLPTVPISEVDFLGQ